jgi:uncharacterized protein GlcG (DUF336 family)
VSILFQSAHCFLVGNVITLTLLVSPVPANGQTAQARMTLADAGAIIAAAERSAALKNVKVSVAVVDSRGDLIALERQPGASGATIDATIGKAMLSAIYLRPSGTFSGASTNPASPITAVNEATGGRLRFTPGGVPIVRRGVLIGAVAVDGATSQHDEAIANDGAAAIP